MRMKIKIILLIAFWSFSMGLWAGDNEFRQVVDLRGDWNFNFDPNDEGFSREYWNIDLPDHVLLPGTTDTNRKGTINTNKAETTFLSRYYSYQGPAWYSKTIDIPSEWNGKHIELFLERTRPTMVWVDNYLAGKSESLSTPHRYNLTSLLTPGKHKITIRVDNGESIPRQIRTSSHACTESTQTNWNGIIGRIELQIMNPLFIASVQTYPQASENSVRVQVTLSQNADLNGKKIRLSASAFNTSKRHVAASAVYPLKDGCKVYEFTYPLGKGAMLWSDLHPALYRLQVAIDGFDEKTVTFGLRDFGADRSHFTINSVQTFLRGKHDACVFPLTGHTAMGLDEWMRYFKICKEYGLNHCRFHSWCPPEACFEAADRVGIYLQPELPIWGEITEAGKELTDFLLHDGEKIQGEYSNHASFVLFALGNELSGDMNTLKCLVEQFRTMEGRHLYAYGSNNFLGWKGHIPGEDFLVTCRLGWGEGYSSHTRASFSFADADEGGYLNNTYPNTKMNFDGIAEKSPVPVIGHETGQFQIYPDYREIAKYTGVLAPWNFEIFRDRLEKAGMAEQADDFLKASGAWAVELYRADIEMNLRSKYMAGFQLLDLQDYPGQGSAYVGILNAFMDSKGLVTPREWKEFCCEVVPLLRMEKYCWRGDDAFSAEVEVANYKESLAGRTLSWRLLVDKKVLKKGRLNLPSGIGVLDGGTINLILPNVKRACKAELSLRIDGTSYRNRYPVWIYPADQRIEQGRVQVVHQLTDSVANALQQGAKVLLIPRKEACGEVTVGGLFQTDYWNYRMFKSICEQAKKPVSPGTLGLLTNPQHPLFADFPTEYHTNWQWYSVIKHSYPLILDRMPKSYRPLVQIIDNIERNHKLGLLFELKVGRGDLLVCMADLEAIRNLPEGNQLYAALFKYMNSSSFSPSTSVTVDELKRLFVPDGVKTEIERLDNISYE